jgi:16S rRNA (adenine1518-N6/adenine1519-N6)-dimethyltransferase
MLPRMARNEAQNGDADKKFLTKKSLGQHFLNGDRVPERMAGAGDVGEGDFVLEIGPGTGALTRTLLKRGATVIAIEADARALVVLESAFQAEIATGRLVLIHGDMRTDSPETLAPILKKQRYKVVANIPYYLSGLLFRTFLETGAQPTTIVFLVQREVALRIARSKKESLLSLSVKVYGDPSYIQTVGRGNFTPPPKVDSAIIAIRNISKDRLGDISEEAFFTIIHAGFASKRKQLLGNLSILYPRDTLMHTFSTLGIRLDIRGEDLSLEMWLSLIRALSLHT